MSHARKKVYWAFLTFGCGHGAHVAVRASTQGQADRQIEKLAVKRCDGCGGKRVERVEAAAQ